MASGQLGDLEWLKTFLGQLESGALTGKEGNLDKIIAKVRDRIKAMETQRDRRPD